MRTRNAGVSARGAKGPRFRDGNVTGTMWNAVPLPSPVPVTEAIAPLPGARLWYTDTGGSGPAVVFLHAASGSGAFWDYQLPALARAGYRVIGYSRRGHGASSADDANDPGVASEDLKNLTAFLGVDRFHAVGVAAGGVYAADFALSYPERLHGLALVASTIGITDAAYVALGAALRPPAFAQLPIHVQELGPSYRAGNPAGVAAWLAREAGSPYTSGRMIFPKTAHEMSWANIETIALPILLLGGDADLWVPPAILRLQASHVPHAEVHVVSEAGHHPYWEQPDVFNRRLLAFLGNRAPMERSLEP